MGDTRVEPVLGVPFSTLLVDTFNPTLKFRMDLEAGENSVSIKIKYNRGSDIVFRGIIGFSLNTTVSQFFEHGDSIKLDVFGHSIFDETFSSTFSTKQFTVYSPNLT